MWSARSNILGLHVAFLRRRVARLAFLTPNLANLALFRDTWRQKNCLAFWRFLFNIWLFSRQLAHAIRLVFRLHILLKSVIKLFRQCVVYFLKRYLQTHKRIKL